MKLQNFTVIFVIIVLPIILLVSLYISTGLKTIKYQALYDTGLITATQDAIQAFEINTLKNKYSANAEIKRSAIKASVKMLENGLCNMCNISSYNTNEIEEYIPAVLFGMNNGFYLYAPSYNPETEKYEHSLKNYVYYSEQLTPATTGSEGGIVIIYHLDSYIEVSGYFDGTYESGEGYLINKDVTEFSLNGRTDARNFEENYNPTSTFTASDYIKYYGTKIDIADELAVNYFVDNYFFSEWFYNKVFSNVTDCEWLDIASTNDPEDPESAFSKHKKEVIRNKIQNVLNSSITAYSKRTYGKNYKMPKLTEEDWEKIYTDVSLTTFFQGKKIGFTEYNGYCVLNSNNHYELINPNLLYFSTDDNNDYKINTTSDYYHDIRCSKISDVASITINQDIGKTIRGWKIGRFQRKTITKTDETTGDEKEEYIYERNELGCYECINGSVNSGTSVYDYIAVAEPSSHTGNTGIAFIKQSYWTSLARERAKLYDDKNIATNIEVSKEVSATNIGGRQYTTNCGDVEYTIKIKNNANKIEYINISDCSENDVDLITKKNIKYRHFSDTNWNDITNLDQINSIGKKDEIIIKYNAQISDKNGDYKVTNNVDVMVDSITVAEAKATCYIMDFTISKTVEIFNTNVDSSNDTYSCNAKYTVTITNPLDTSITVNLANYTKEKPDVANFTIKVDTILTNKLEIKGKSSIPFCYEADISNLKISESITRTAKAMISHGGLTLEREASATVTADGGSSTVTFDLRGDSSGMFGDTYKVDVEYSKTIKKEDIPNDAVKDGYHFGGWYPDENWTKEFDFTKPIKTDITVYARYYNYVTFMDGDKEIKKTEVNDNKTVLEALGGNIPKLTKTGYTFDGWYTNKTGGNKFDFNNIISTDTILYAHWTAKKCIVTFDSNGGNPPSPKNKEVTYGQTYKVLPKPTRTGYKFDGWFTKISGGSKVTSSTTVTTAQNHTLYAHWTAIEYTVTFDSNGGNPPSPKNKKVKYDETYKELPTPTRTGCTFAGWFTAQSGGDKVTSSTTVKTAKNHTLYAHWDVTVTFMTHTTTMIKNQTIPYNGNATQPQINLTNSPWIFAGWWMNGTRFDFKTNIERSITLDARYKIDVLYDSDNKIIYVRAANSLNMQITRVNSIGYTWKRDMEGCSYSNNNIVYNYCYKFSGDEKVGQRISLFIGNSDDAFASFNLPANETQMEIFSE